MEAARGSWQDRTQRRDRHHGWGTQPAGSPRTAAATLWGTPSASPASPAPSPAFSSVQGSCEALRAGRTRRGDRVSRRAAQNVAGSGEAAGGHVHAQGGPVLAGQGDRAMAGRRTSGSYFARTALGLALGGGPL